MKREGEEKRRTRGKGGNKSYLITFVHMLTTPVILIVPSIIVNSQVQLLNGLEKDPLCSSIVVHSLRIFQDKKWSKYSSR